MTTTTVAGEVKQKLCRRLPSHSGCSCCTLSSWSESRGHLARLCAGDVPSWDKVNSASGDVRLHQDTNVFVSEAEAGQVFEVSLGKARQAYLLCIEGDLQVNDVALSARDAAELTAPSGTLPLQLRTGPSGSHFMLIEMAHEG